MRIYFDLISLYSTQGEKLSTSIQYSLGLIGLFWTIHIRTSVVAKTINTPFQGLATDRQNNIDDRLARSAAPLLAYYYMLFWDRLPITQIYPAHQLIFCTVTPAYQRTSPISRPVTAPSTLTPVHWIKSISNDGKPFNADNRHLTRSKNPIWLAHLAILMCEAASQAQRGRNYSVLKAFIRENRWSDCWKGRPVFHRTVFTLQKHY